ncbi:ATP-dependent DNA helicase PIF1-like protein [Tanacetum coccineum]|uniref:ATP-dependent DNA helicase n=1 Tax=Tanacetum coccineum TaxID=301880 RepID=A0ABQ5AQJ0_9ASTR
MIQNYQDAMALSRAYGNPDMFITFTSNPKWPKIAGMLAFHLGQKPHERPEVGTRVFKMKLTELLDDLTKREIFGKSRAGDLAEKNTYSKALLSILTVVDAFLNLLSVVYVIEFQKRSLPHAHILLWLEEEWKCKTPGQIDDIISEEMSSPTDDPEGYKVVTEYILNFPCGKGVACTIEGKCSKKFPKPFYAETMIDEDWYPVYRSRDSKVHAVKARKLTDAELPKNYVWDERAKIWKPQACFAYGLLNDDKEWAHAIKEASFWALGPQLRDLFVTMLLFYELAEEQIKNYYLLEIETFLNINESSLTDFQHLPQLNPTLLTNMDNRLIREALDFDIKKSKAEHAQIHSLLNPEQRAIYEEDESPMMQKYAFEALDKTQILPVIPKDKRIKIVQACINRSELWKSCKVFMLTRSMRVNEYSTNGAFDTRKQQFNKLVLDVGDGTLPAKKKKIEMRKRGLKFLKNSSLTQQALLLSRL